MKDRELPGWATRPDDPSGRIVTCPNCGRPMSWAEYLEHGPECPESETRED